MEVFHCPRLNFLRPCHKLVVSAYRPKQLFANYIRVLCTTCTHLLPILCGTTILISPGVTYLSLDIQFNTTKTRSNKFRLSHLWLPLTRSKSYETVSSVESTFKVKACFLSQLHRHTTHITTAATAVRITHKKTPLYTLQHVRGAQICVPRRRGD